ncbi:hypothetical protein ACFFX1_45515 [Dactylosporangium sucinum]|uniref:FAD/NAD(P)-binding domain-containing protein n=1 Tax=Dactylosporangium sucinum TaxID=1424081 RepID=A0A917X064_9ACTN|nr:hypothetical protein [Dactylosporangium sucinum]GGM47765.1 hypothetical protein GCM10007977_056740 [Dactylosporangium sucinum]
MVISTYVFSIISTQGRLGLRGQELDQAGGGGHVADQADRLARPPPDTLETGFPGVYAVGDVTSVGTPKAGVFAEGQAAVAAARIVATIRGESPAATYDGRGICYLEFGGDRVAKVDVTFRAGERPFCGLQGPSADLAADKHAFGTDRIRRWFGREWRF